MSPDFPLEFLVGHFTASPGVLLVLEVSVEVLVRPDGLEINETDAIVYRIAKQI